jgi:hypothetical protein
MLTVVGFVNQLARFTGTCSVYFCKEIIKDDMMLILLYFILLVHQLHSYVE